jgi:hypothetical protein
MPGRAIGPEPAGPPFGQIDDARAAREAHAAASRLVRETGRTPDAAGVLVLLMRRRRAAVPGVFLLNARRPAPVCYVQWRHRSCESQR